MGLGAYWRLVRAGFVLAREGVFSLVNTQGLSGVARTGLRVARLVERGAVKRHGRVENLTRALNRLGPTYVKFGQTLATRPDIVGEKISNDLSALQDRMEPFDPKLVPGLLAEALGDKAKSLTELSPPIAAASIAQVHKARLAGDNGQERTVAVKILRPGIRQRFRRDLRSYYAGARLAERLVPGMRRLRPVEVVETLDRSARFELDLRLEAAAISEFSENTAKDTDFSAPEVIWEQTAANVLTTSWVEAIPVRDHNALGKAGIERKALATRLLQGFLRHAIRDGFFHADMHPGNLFADPATGNIVAVDFGIMGRINAQERRFLADILFGFITRDYARIAQRHFEIGYVPADQSVDDFAMALRAVGEPLHGRTARDVSMARLLGQLFETTEMFAMQTRPELILLQKNMVIAEGVARALDPDLDIWIVAKPVVADWLKEQMGPAGRIAEARRSVTALTQTVQKIPGLVARADAALSAHETWQEQSRPGRSRVLMMSGFGLVALAAGAVLSRMLF